MIGRAPLPRGPVIGTKDKETEMSLANLTRFERALDRNGVLGLLGLGIALAVAMVSVGL